MTDPTATSKSSNRLGRGLTALIGETEAIKTYGPEADNVVEIDINEIKPNPNQPRKHFDDIALSELANSIRNHGILTPIIVRKSEDNNDYFEIVAGERRWRAAKKADLSRIPVVIRSVDDLALLELGIIENIQREDLNPIEEARAYKALIDRFGRSQGNIAESVGKSRSHISNLLRLLTGPEKIQDYLLRGKITHGHARALLMAEDPESLVDRVIAEGWSVRQIEKHLTNLLIQKPNAPKLDNRNQLEAQALSADLSRKLGFDIEVSESKSGGTVKIRYKTLEQLDDICRRLNQY